MHRYTLCLAAVALAAGCNGPATSVPVRVVDLIHEVPGAEQRPPATVQISAQALDGVTRPAILTAVPSRVTWRMPLPRHGILRTYVAVDDGRGDSAGAAASPPVRFRIGISDRRTYETLSTITTDRPGWTELRVDLSGYAGWQWSVFYRPDRTIWNLVLAADAVAGAVQPRAVWGAPEILGDVGSAREYVDRRKGLRAPS